MFLRHSLPSVLSMKPSEVVLCMDDTSPQEIQDYAIRECEKYEVELNVMRIKKNPEWKFHQYYVRRMGYLHAKYDKIFTFDVDCVLYPSNIMVGYDMVGRDNVTFVTFRKKLVYIGLTNSMRSTLYDIRRQMPRKKLSVNKEPVPFIGIYWLYRPYYFDLIHEDVAKSIFNGEDTLASYLIYSQSKYRHIHLDDVVACWSLRLGNEDIPWRQEQLGIYLGCLSMRSREPLRQLIMFYRLMLMVVWKLYPDTMKGYFIGRQYNAGLRSKIASQGFEQMIMHSKKLRDGRWLFDYS